MKCEKCGNTIPSDSRFCPFCREKVTTINQPLNKDTSGKNIEIIACLAVALMFSLVYSIAATLIYNDLSKTSTEQMIELRQYQEAYANEDFAKYEELLRDLTENSDEDFCVNKHFFVMRVGQEEIIELHTRFPEQATVYTSENGTSASVEFLESSWGDSTQLKIEAQCAGTTEIVFSNSIDEKSFSIMVVVR